MVAYLCAHAERIAASAKNENRKESVSTPESSVLCSGGRGKKGVQRYVQVGLFALV